MLALGSLLNQVRPADALVNNVFTATLNTEIMLIVVTNTSGAAASFNFFHDNDGVVFDATTALYWNVPAPIDGPVLFQAQAEGSGIQLNKGASIAVQSTVASALTFSIYGATEQTAQRVRG